MISDQTIIKERLLKKGIQIDSIYDLVNTNEKYPEAIDTLIDLLNKNINFHPKITEGIVRALAIKEAKGRANEILFNLYQKVSKDENLFRWAIGNTINVIVEPKDEERILEIVNDKSNGTSRQMFVLALGKIKSDNSENVLINLLDDEDVAAHAIISLGKLKSLKAKSKIAELVNHEKYLIKKEAKKALKKIIKNT